MNQLRKREKYLILIVILALLAKLITFVMRADSYYVIIDAVSDLALLLYFFFKLNQTLAK